MGQLVYILGRSGTGKSYSLRNFPKDKLAVINVQGKMLPFKGASAIEQTPTDNSANIIKALDIYAHDYNSIVVDDYQYVMSNEFMRRSAEKGYDKFTEIARHAWDIANKVRSLPDDVIVYILCHTDRDDDGNEKIKTIGRLLDEKICLEGMSTIVLKTNVSDGQYSFLTQNNGKDTVKSPAGMFPTYAIDNDLWYVDQKIRNYYEMAGHMSDEAVAAMEEAVAKPEVTKEAAEGRRSRRKAAVADVDKGTGTIVGAIPAEQKQIEAEQAIADATADGDKLKEIEDLTDQRMKAVEGIERMKHTRRRKTRDVKEEHQTEEAPAEEKKEEAAADQPAEVRKQRRRKKREEALKAEEEMLDGFMNLPEHIDDEEVPFK